MKRPRLLIEEWLPAAAIGVECMRERSTGQQPPDKRLHVWWARRPLTASRAAVLASLLPADFPRDVFERLLGFWGTSERIVEAQALLDWAKQAGVKRINNPHGGRAFKRKLREDDLALCHDVAAKLWGPDITVIDPMAGGGSIPLESARLGFRTLANEYNPVACSILEATVDYPFSFGEELARRARRRGAELRKRFNARVEKFFPKHGIIPPHCYIFARTVPCPDTQFDTPLVPDWHLLKPSSGRRVVAEPVVDKKKGTWTVRIREIGTGAGQLRAPPQPTYSDGKGISLFKNLQIPSDYIKAKAQAREMRSALYAVALKTPQGLKFEPPTPADLVALEGAEKEVTRLRRAWERADVLPMEVIPDGDQPGTRFVIAGINRWNEMFSSRQLLALAVLIEEIRNLLPEVVRTEGAEVGGAVALLLALIVDKFANHNSIVGRFESTKEAIKGVFGRHGYEFHPAWAEMAPCNAGTGLDWAIENVLEASGHLVSLPRDPSAQPVEISLGSATTLPQVADDSVTAVVVDPPYAGNVQYSELANFFYVLLKRTEGHRHPEWFSTYLCETEQEAVVNISRHRGAGRGSLGTRRIAQASEARRKAHAFYQSVMTDAFRECRRILRDEGALTVMFTHKKQEVWEALFSSLIRAGFTITATWPVKTESEHSLHQAKKNAAQSTVILVARKRPEDAGLG